MILLILHVHTAEAILEIFRECTEFGVAAVVTVKKEIAVVVERRMDALIAKLVFEAHGMIATTLVAVRLNAVETIFERERIVAAVTSLALGEMIADAIFAAELMHGEIWNTTSKFLHILLQRTSLIGISKVDFFHASLVFLFTELLIEHTILFLVESDAAETMGTAETIFAELALATVAAILGMIDHVTITAIDTFRAPFATHAKCKP